MGSKLTTLMGAIDQAITGGKLSSTWRDVADKLSVQLSGIIGTVAFKVVPFMALESLRPAVRRA